MLNYELTHPRILHALAAARHSSQILIADGNFPARTTLGPNATLCNLNLKPGLVDCVTVLEAILSAIVIEKAAVMDMSKNSPHAPAHESRIWDEFREVLADDG
ncbi:RbsD / FucU transport protein family protein [Poriferisphaera corsica]|uniref:RbsD / FucU transport protein family protein n=1 Tax=Poriferisphaera corsica TaxID=2528020 RepID=A0A517YRD8_9BACT|nr:RbsD / FucU transport protein family protein [Poriferisphaera corsica]